jgi:hypothetical protein
MARAPFLWVVPARALVWTLMSFSWSLFTRILMNLCPTIELQPKYKQNTEAQSRAAGPPAGGRGLWIRRHGRPPPADELDSTRWHHQQPVRLASGWCWFVLREEYCWLLAGLFWEKSTAGWFVVREKYCWLVADKPSEQGAPAAMVSTQWGQHRQSPWPWLLVEERQLTGRIKPWD